MKTVSKIVQWRENRGMQRGHPMQYVPKHNGVKLIMNSNLNGQKILKVNYGVLDSSIK